MIRKALGLMIGGVLALACVLFVPSARADLGDQATQFTFNQPVQLPGNTVLPAGTYWFMMPNYTNGQQMMQVFNADRTQCLATVETFDSIRPNVTDNPAITFSKLSANQPLLLVSWFYPGESTGHELEYSPRQENRLSEGNLITINAQPAPLVQ